MTWESHQNPRSDIQFPQPTRPINVYDMDCRIGSQATNDMDPIINDNNFWQGELPQQHYSNEWTQAKTTTAVVEEDQEEEGEEAIEKLVRFISEMYEKLPEKIRHQFNLEGLIGQIRTKKRSQVDFTYSTRGLDQAGSDQMKEFAGKLERFKIRTLDPNGGTIVKEESKH